MDLWILDKQLATKVKNEVVVSKTCFNTHSLSTQIVQLSSFRPRAAWRKCFSCSPLMAATSWRRGAIVYVEAVGYHVHDVIRKRAKFLDDVGMVAEEVGGD